MQTDELKKKYDEIKMQLHPDVRQLMEQWAKLVAQYENDFFEFDVRGKKIKQDLTYQSLSGTRISKVYLPTYKDWGDIVKWQLQCFH
jgi:methylmalonyl-CoA mutase